MWTVIYFLRRFFSDLYHATIFAALEYDDQLRMTKTPQQRVIIWTVIGFVALGALYLALHSLWHFLNTLEAHKIVPGE